MNNIVNKSAGVSPDVSDLESLYLDLLEAIESRYNANATRVQRFISDYILLLEEQLKIAQGLIQEKDAASLKEKIIRVRRLSKETILVLAEKREEEIASLRSWIEKKRQNA